MAALFILVGVAIANKKEHRRQQKKARAEARYRELQHETQRRLAGYDSNQYAIPGDLDDEMEPGSGQLEEGDQAAPTRLTSPPPYERHATGSGESALLQSPPTYDQRRITSTSRARAQVQ
ncbi:hypothetical protein BDY17DRAFT_348979 [Neohortaea acidophila]|uniref:Uncharacterized protein n=1 Tax=Neohortaea acidophila TaxID=245834 RepID=A0A6A6PI88_9PEZI|nr:uncharacterized protein BDY17DRAFT_348979 [Neohortaea acidophila]KAF2479424.1 hypothetical protein BDY17DRAFT_348979 [Neohortaea acidophila]